MDFLIGGVVFGGGFLFGAYHLDGRLKDLDFFDGRKIQYSTHSAYVWLMSLSFSEGYSCLDG
jgi:hypothetical protein